MHLLKIVLYKIKAFGGSIKKILKQKKRLFFLYSLKMIIMR